MATPGSYINVSYGTFMYIYVQVLHLRVADGELKSARRAALGIVFGTKGGEVSPHVSPQDL